MPFITVVANIALEGRWEKTQKRDICSRHSFDVTWVLSYKNFWDLESKIAEQWSMKDTIDGAIREVNQDFHCTEDTFIFPEELKSLSLENSLKISIMKG